MVDGTAVGAAAQQEARKLKHAEKERLEVEKLEQRIKEQTPARGSQLEEAANFEFFPLSDATKRGLQRGKFTKPTLIQVGAIPHALAGRDILAAAKTGSGKTLAFLIPILEKLYRSRWDVEDGLGALVISPTRELALQIFEVLRSLGKMHSFSAGLVIGGKNFKEEQYRLIRMNILICTPGRLLQHMEQTPNFDPSNLQILVLDEADRILDMGFQAQLTSIVSYLPPTRQTMLFSATQTKSVKDLAKLSLNEPEYIAVHEKSAQATPSGLAQSYVVCGLEKKLDVLLSFIKSHLKQKAIVFLSTCRQVRFVHQVFCKLQPGIPLLALHGKYKQGKRVEIYYEFLNKPAAVLFATDIAARGLDFPQVDWVVQLDCPEDTANYIHRVGRTARYNKQGKALLTLLPSEVEGMTKAFEEAKIPIKEIKVNPTKTQSCRQKVTSVVAADKEIKALGQKAFMSYVRSVYLQPNREVFDTSALPLDEFALSYGLPGAPRMPFLSKLKEDQESMREELRGKKNVNRKLQMLKDKIKAEKERKRLEKQLTSLKKDGSKAKQATAVAEAEEEASDEEDSLMVVKRRHDWDKDGKDEEDDEELIDLDASRKKKKAKKIRVDNEVSYNRVVFDEDGNSMKVLEQMAAQHIDVDEEFADVEAKSKQFQAQVAARLKEKDAEDRRLEKERVRAKHHKKRMKEKGEREGDEDEDEDDEGADGPRLGGVSSGDEDGDEDMESAGSDDDDSEGSGDDQDDSGDDDDDSESESEDDSSSKKRKVRKKCFESGDALNDSVYEDEEFDEYSDSFESGDGGEDDPDGGNESNTTLHPNNEDENDDNGEEARCINETSCRYESGDLVQVFWADEHEWFSGKVAQMDKLDGRYFVQYDDREEVWETAEHVRYAPDSFELAYEVFQQLQLLILPGAPRDDRAAMLVRLKGAKALVHWRDSSSWFPGSISQVDSEACALQIKYDDGDLRWEQTNLISSTLPAAPSHADLAAVEGEVERVIIPRAYKTVISDHFQPERAARPYISVTNTIGSVVTPRRGRYSERRYLHSNAKLECTVSDDQGTTTTATITDDIVSRDCLIQTDIDTGEWINNSDLLNQVQLFSQCG